jgi:hypothetical protein
MLPMNEANSVLDILKQKIVNNTTVLENNKAEDDSVLKDSTIFNKIDEPKNNDILDTDQIKEAMNNSDEILSQSMDDNLI